MSGSHDPAISVLLPVRDAEATLELCLRSVARQRERDFECVIVDDGSKDRSAELAETWARRDPRFRVLRRSATGIAGALNTGVGECRGRYVARMDADDWMHRERLARQRAALDGEAGWSGVGCHVRCFPRRALRAGLRDYESWLRSIRSAESVRVERFVECPLPHPTWMMRREVFRSFEYGAGPAGDWPEDYDLLLRLLARGDTVGVVPDRLLAWREGPQRLWRRDPRYARAAFLACRAYHLARGPLRRDRCYLLWGYGETGKALRRELLRYDRQVAGIVELHPGRIGERIHGAPVVAPTALGTLRRHPLLVSVAGAGPRTEIRAELAAQGWVEGRDFYCVA